MFFEIPNKTMALVPQRIGLPISTSKKVVVLEFETNTKKWFPSTLSAEFFSGLRLFLVNIKY